MLEWHRRYRVIDVLTEPPPDMMMFYIIVGVSGLVEAGALVGIIFLLLWFGGCYPPK